MSVMLFREDPYMRNALAEITGHTANSFLVPDQSLFYPRGGGQPGDSGLLRWENGTLRIVDTLKGEGDEIHLVPEENATLPPPGTEVMQELDWDRRYAHMRMHTALHLLSVVVGRPVSGGAIDAHKGRLDFDMPEAVEDKEALSARLNALITRDLPVLESWIGDAELDARPELVKTMSVQPPRGQGQVRLVAIGEGEEQVDIQPCGGTHVRRTGELGLMRISRIQKKGRQNRRFYIEAAP